MKNTKRTLIVSLLSIVLCISMLIGSTFAWFTDTATTGVNKIVSGTLDIDLVSNGVSLNEQPLQFVDTKTRGFIDPEKVLWEPGATYQLQEVTLVNLGSLAAKYQIALTLEGYVTAETGESLSDVIEVIFVEDGKDVVKGTLKDILINNGGVFNTGTLMPKGAENNADKATYGTVKLHMQETAGNAYQGLSLTNLALTVYATQATVETDSFDDQYDAGAYFADKVVEGTNNLAGEDAKNLEGTVAVTGVVADAADFENGTYAIGSRDTLAQSKVDTLVLDGADIDSAVASGDIDSGFATISVNVPADSTVIIKNSTINGKFSVNVPATEYPYSAANIADLVFENCTINGAWMGYPNSFKSVTFKNCIFTNEGMDLANMYTANCFPVWFVCDSETTVNFEGCTFNTNRGIHINGRQAKVTVKVTNCTFNLKASSVSNENESKVNCFKFLNTVDATISGNTIATANALFDISGANVTMNADYAAANTIAEGIKMNRND